MLAPLATALRLLFFRVSREELLGFDNRHLALGLLFTWIAGVGRHWDHVDVTWHQKLGLHSVGYVFVLAALLWAVAWPLAQPGWTYRRVLTYIMLTAPPGFIYAIPVERQFGFEDAYMLNLYFLLGVSVWRVALWFQLLHLLGRLHLFQTIIVALLPLAAIATYAAIAGKVSDLFIGVMAGNRQVTVTDGVKQFLGMFVMLSFLSLAVTGPSYLGMLVRAAIHRHQQRQSISVADTTSSEED